MRRQHTKYDTFGKRLFNSGMMFVTSSAPKRYFHLRKNVACILIFLATSTSVIPRYIFRAIWHRVCSRTVKIKYLSWRAGYGISIETFPHQRFTFRWDFGRVRLCLNMKNISIIYRREREYAVWKSWFKAREEVGKERKKGSPDHRLDNPHPQPLERAFVFSRLPSNRGGNDICRRGGLLEKKLSSTPSSRQPNDIPQS